MGNRGFQTCGKEASQPGSATAQLFVRIPQLAIMETGQPFTLTGKNELV